MVLVCLCLFAPAALAQTRTIAVYVDGPDAARIRAEVVPAVGVGTEIADDGAFRAELAREGQRKPLGKSVDSASIDRMRNAARAIGAEAVIVVRVRRDSDARRILLLIVDVSDGPSPVKNVRLDLRSYEKDAEQIAAALRGSLDRYAPSPEAPPVPAAREPVEAAASPAPTSPSVRGEPARSLPQGKTVPEATAAHLAVTSLLDVALGVEAVGRHFTYDNGISRKTDNYSLFPALGIGVRAKVFPFAASGAPWGDIGVAVDSSLTFLQTNELEGASTNTVPLSYSLGLCARIHPGTSERFLFGASAGYAFASFGTVGPANSELPDVTYRSVRSAVDARVAFGRFSVLAAAALRVIADPGHISTRFYNPRGFGLDAEVGTAFMFVRRLEARVTARYEQYSFSFHPPPQAMFSAGNASDQLYGIRTSVAFIY